MTAIAGAALYSLSPGSLLALSVPVSCLLTWTAQPGPETGRPHECPLRGPRIHRDANSLVS